MHALQSPSYRPSAILPPMTVAAPDVQGAAPTGVAARAVMRWVWHSRFGTIVIEVRGDDVFVDGDRVTPHAP